MRIVADENMPYVSEWFAALGDVQTLPGRSLDSAAVRNADILLVRSVTNVNRALLEGSSVQFVGSATIGTDHLDTAYLASQGIAYANAPGCNANAVVDYVLSAMAALEGVLERLIEGGTVGIIGLGNVGSRLCLRLQSMGIRCIGYDPYLSDTSLMPLATLDAVLNADVVCCHTPLTHQGLYPTWHMLNRDNLKHMRSDALLLNAGRGGAIKNDALPLWLSKQAQRRLVLDVWESEPAIDSNLLQDVHIATPHIAGYSLDGKLAGTRMVLNACCAHFDLPVPDTQQIPVAPWVRVNTNLSGVNLIRETIRAVYDVREDDARMRAAMKCAAAQRPYRFDELRKNYPERREFGVVRIQNWNELTAEQQQLLRGLGFVAEMS